MTGGPEWPVLGKPCFASVGPVFAGLVARNLGVCGAGMTTAEYAVGTLAAVAFAVVLMAVVKSGAVKTALTGIIQSALSVAS